MKKKIRLYRPTVFKIISGVLFFVFFGMLALRVAFLVVFGFKDTFFMEWELYKSVLYEFMIVEDTLQFISFFIYMALDLFLAVLCFIGAFCNKMTIKEDRIIFLYPPRLFFRIYTCNICRITPVTFKDLSLGAMVLNFTTGNEYLYKIEEYEKTYYVACRAKGEMEALAAEINAKGKKRECEEDGFDPKKLTKGDIAFIFAVLLVIYSIIRKNFT